MICIHHSLVLFALLALALGLSGCREGGGSGSETMDGKLTGRLVYPGGAPASGAAVVLRPGDFLTDTADAGEPHFRPDAYAGVDGAFELALPDSGPQVLEIRDGLGHASLLRFEATGPSRSRELAADTLKPSGRLEGTVQRLPGERERIYARLRGLDRIVLADSNGAFAFEDLPAGEYQLALTSAVPGRGYAPPGEVRVAAGDTLVLDTLPLVTFAGEDYSAWSHSGRVFLSAASAGVTGEIADFPLLVRLDASRFDFSAARPDGWDIRFANTAGTHLPFEVEEWDPVAGKAAVWVLAPKVSPVDGDAGIRLYWGRPEAAEMSSGAALFKPSRGFAAVWHFANSLRDATANGNHGWNAGSDPEPALIGGGRRFRRAQSDSVVVGYSPSFDLRAFTVSAWARPASRPKGPHGILGTRFGSDYTFDMKINSAGAHADIGDGMRWLSPEANSLFAWSPGAWSHLAYVVSRSGYRIFVNGALAASDTLAGEPLFMKSIQTLNIGNCFDSYRASQDDLYKEHFDGLLDEIQVSAGMRGPDWIKLSFENQKPGSAWVEIRD